MKTLEDYYDQEPKREGCLECGASFQLHVEFGHIKYPKAFNLPPATFYTLMDEANLISTRISEYGICTAYKSSL